MLGVCPPRKENKIKQFLETNVNEDYIRIYLDVTKVMLATIQAYMRKQDESQ